MSTANPSAQMSVAVAAARDREDIVVGNEIVRHRRSSRVIHWTVAVTFLVCVATGMPIWTPLFGWMASLFGGLSVCRVLHPWAGLAFFLSSAVMFFHWLAEMRLEPGEKGWLGAKLFEYMRYQGDDSQVGKYNGGQKLLFWAVSLGALALVLSGLVMWFPLAFPQLLREFSYLLHDATFILFAVAIVFHVYLGTAAEPGTFGSMTRGTVTRRWARFHHPRWYREVTGEQAGRK
ncbi:MAG TPA: formate dehydrogenase subunit gamma [Thermoanaerobaculia bacterium]|nr:formate dehydrogenase subunit gamma [Thermoanaerobaculia bacterium]